jgi:hypothetical protein
VTESGIRKDALFGHCPHLLVRLHSTCPGVGSAHGKLWTFGSSLRYFGAVKCSTHTDQVPETVKTSGGGKALEV